MDSVLNGGRTGNRWEHKKFVPFIATKRAIEAQFGPLRRFSDRPNDTSKVTENPKPHTPHADRGTNRLLSTSSHRGERSLPGAGASEVLLEPWVCFRGLMHSCTCGRRPMEFLGFGGDSASLRL